MGSFPTLLLSLRDRFLFCTTDRQLWLIAYGAVMPDEQSTKDVVFSAVFLLMGICLNQGFSAFNAHTAGVRGVLTGGTQQQPGTRPRGADQEIALRRSARLSCGGVTE